MQENHRKSTGIWQEPFPFDICEYVAATPLEWDGLIGCTP